MDQGFEHGPLRSFGINPPAYDPLYHFRLAIDAGLSALAAPYGLLSAGADRHAGEIPLILKANNANALGSVKDEAITATVHDALELGCVGIGYTIYPGSDRQYEMFEEVRAGAAEARANGLAVVVWAYPRGGSLKPEDETALDVVAYGAHIAAELGAHIVKVKAPSAVFAQEENAERLMASGLNITRLEDRITHVVQSTFAGRRIVVFSGGPTRSDDELLQEVRGIHAGGGFGSIVGRNAFQRPHDEAVALLHSICDIHLGKA